jgi:hypothetical protein
MILAVAGEEPDLIKAIQELEVMVHTYICTVVKFEPGPDPTTSI